MPFDRATRTISPARRTLAGRSVAWLVVTILALATVPWSLATSDAATEAEPGFHAPIASLILANPASAGTSPGFGERHAWHHQAIDVLPTRATTSGTPHTAPCSHPRHAQHWFARRNLEGG